MAERRKYTQTFKEESAGRRATGERANALLTQRWKALRHINLSPSRIGAIAAGALVLTTLERGTR